MGSPILEADELPSDAVVSVTFDDCNVPLLFSELVMNRQVLRHPAVKQLQPISEMEHDRELDLVMTSPPSYELESDPNVTTSNRHLLLPLAKRASYYEDFHKVIIKY